jgi:hypothetical protein
VLVAWLYVKEPRERETSRPDNVQRLRIYSSKLYSKRAHTRSIMLRNIACCATGWPCMVLIDLIVNGQTCVAQNKVAQHDWSCMGPLVIRSLSAFNTLQYSTGCTCITDHISSLLYVYYKFTFIIVIITDISRSLCLNSYLISIPGASRFSEKQRVWNGVHSASWGQLRSYLKGKK